MEIIGVGLAESWRRVAASAGPAPINSHGSLTTFPIHAGYNRFAARKVLMSFSVKIRQRDNVALVEVSGHLTHFEVGALRDAIELLLLEKRNNILLNLSQLHY